MAEPGVVLVVEDDPIIMNHMRTMLGAGSHRVLAASTVAEAQAIISDQQFDLALLDISLDGDTRRTPMAARGGFRLLDMLQKEVRSIPVVFVTGEDSAETAMDLVTRGAHHYLTKPVVQEVLLNVADLAIQLGRARRRLDGFGVAQSANALEWYVGETPKMLEAASKVSIFAPTDHPIMILGETGTGKEVVAKTIHAQSTRAKGPLITMNCAGMPRDLIASTLFGHVVGAFTGATDSRRGYFEEASGGTLFLDEVGDMPLDLQAHLLRAVQDGTIRPVGADKDRQVDCRIIAATNVDIESAIQEGRFRADLFFRLGLDPIHLPPLRERVADIPYFAGLFLRGERATSPSVPKRFTERAQRALMTYHWPGNTRELERTVQMAGLYANGEPAVDLPHLRFNALALSASPAAVNGHGSAQGAATGMPSDLPPAGLDLPGVCAAWEERMVRQALARTHGNQTAAAVLLGMSRDMLRSRVEKFTG